MTYKKLHTWIPFLDNGPYRPRIEATWTSVIATAMVTLTSYAEFGTTVWWLTAGVAVWAAVACGFWIKKAHEETGS